MKRREFITALGGAAAAWPFVANAQTAADRPVRIGLLRVSPVPERSLAALRRGLSAKGYAEGRQYVLVLQFGDGDAQTLPELTTRLVRDDLDVIVTEGNIATLAARGATDTIPIVMATSADPQKSGLIETLSRPGGNVTGNSSEAPEMSGKLLQLAEEIMPHAQLRRPYRTTYHMGTIQPGDAGRGTITYIENSAYRSCITQRRGQAVDAQAKVAIVRGRPFFSTKDVKLTVERAAAHQNGQSICLTTVFETYGPATPADISLRMRSTYPDANWRMRHRLQSKILRFGHARRKCLALF